MSSKRVLVAYGTRHRATAGIAGQIARTLREDGLDAVVLPADAVDDVRGFDAVVLGGSLYAGRWSSKARHCAERNADSLRDRPVWMFSSGPLDRSAEEQTIGPVPEVSEEMSRVGAREHMTFGGSLTDRTAGLVAKVMRHQGRSGDFRNPARIRKWAHHISSELTDA